MRIHTQHIKGTWRTGYHTHKQSAGQRGRIKLWSVNYIHVLHLHMRELAAAEEDTSVVWGAFLRADTVDFAD